MYGYYTHSCYMGFINGSYMRFETEAAYREYMEGQRMKILQKIEVNNQNTLVIGIEEATYHKWLLKPNGEKETDPFWSTVISEDMYKLLIKDYTEGKIPDIFMNTTTKYENPFVDGNMDTVIGLCNWFSYAYTTWNGKTKTWTYGRNKNYEYEMETLERDI